MMWFVSTACFNSDSLLYAECRSKEDDCSPAGSEPQGAITPRACFTPRADIPGYCVPRCGADQDCKPFEDLRATNGDDVTVECHTVHEPGPPPVPYEACVITCVHHADCPAAMACEDYDGYPGGFRVCVPTDQ